MSSGARLAPELDAGPGRANFRVANSRLLPTIPPSKDVNAESGEAGAEKNEGAGFRDSDVVDATLAVAILVILCKGAVQSKPRG
jgi:hypothetical protein